MDSVAIFDIFHGVMAWLSLIFLIFLVYAVTKFI